MIRQKVFALEQAQVKMKQEFVIPSKTTIRGSEGCASRLLTIGLFYLATRRKFECYDMSLNHAASKLSRPTSPVQHSMLALPRRHPRHWAMVPVICLVESWPIKEVVLPILPNL